MALILGAIGYLIYGNFQDTMVYYYTPKELNEKKDSLPDKSMRVGGLVKVQTLKKEKGNLDSTFVLTDGAYDVNVKYHGLLPDLFKEGKGAIVEGKMGSGGIFEANNVMVKHSEEYKPKKLKKKAHKDYRQ